MLAKDRVSGDDEHHDAAGDDDHEGGDHSVSIDVQFGLERENKTEHFNVYFDTLRTVVLNLMTQN